MQYQHNIPKPTNTAALIGAVLVGLLALACGQYRKLNPEKLDTLISQALPERVEPEAGPKVEIVPAASNSDVPVDVLIERALDAERKIEAAHESWLSGNIADADEAQLSRWRKQILLAYRAVMTRPTNVENQRTITLLRLKVEYQLARTMPDVFGKGFLRYAAFLAKNEKHTRTGVMASVMLFAFVQDPAKMEMQTIISDLDQLVGNYVQDGAGIFIYSMYAEELKRLRQNVAAIAVLHHGLLIYKGQPGVGRLFNQLVDLTGE